MEIKCGFLLIFFYFLLMKNYIQHVRDEYNASFNNRKHACLFMNI